MLERIREARKNEKGFTLIELLIVIVILGVLAGIVVFAVSAITDKGSTSACKSDITTVTTAEEAYYAQNSTYAADVATLKAAGFLHSEPDTVEITADNAATPPTVEVVGAAGASRDCSAVTV